MPARSRRRKSSGHLASTKEELRAREMAVYDGLMQGYQDVLDGKTVRAQDIFVRIGSERGWYRHTG